jgi:WD40 repeat protein
MKNNSVQKTLIATRYYNLLLLVLLAAFVNVNAQKPILGLPIGHSGDILHMSISRDGKYVFTATETTLKLWDFRTGKVLRSNNQYGATDRATLSPDANQVFFISGFTDPFPWIWDIEKNTIEEDTLAESRTALSPSEQSFLESISNTGSADFKVYDQFFSNDGKLALLVDENLYFQYWDVKNKKMKARGVTPGSLISSPPYALRLNQEFQPFVGFGITGPLAILREGQHTLQVWDLAKGTILRSITDTSMFFFLAVLSPDGRSIIAAAGNKIQHWDLESGRLIKTFQNEAVNFANVGPRPTGNGVFVGTEAGLRYWNFEKGSISDTWPEATQLDQNNRPFHLQATPPSFLRVWQDGKLQQKNLPALSRTITAPDNYMVSPDLKKAVFQSSRYNPDLGSKADSLWVWDIEKDRQILLLEKDFRYISPDLQYGIYTYREKKPNTDEYTNYMELWNLNTGKKLLLPDNYSVMSYDTSPDGKMLIISDLVDEYDYHVTFHSFDLETGQQLSKFTPTGVGNSPVIAISPDKNFLLFGDSDVERPIQLLDARTGDEVRTFKGQKGGIVEMAFSADGRLAYTTARDNTLRIWEVATGKEKAALIALGDQDWVVTTPDGLFDASPGAMAAMYYTIGREVIDLEQLKERYYEPGLLSKLMGLNQDPIRSIEAFNTLPLYPEMNAQLSADNLKLQVSLTPRNGGIGKLSVFVNGKEVAEDTNPQRAKSVNIDLTAFSAYYLPNKPSKLALRVYNQAGWLKSSALELDYQPPATARGTQNAGNNEPVLKGNPRFFAVVVGTSNYAGEKLDLKFADKDATCFTQALRAASPKVFGDNVFVTLLNTDANDKNRQDVSSKTTIKKAFADIAAKAQAQDILVVYFSGHGVNYGAAESGQFYYLTKDIASEILSDPEIRNNYAISSSELTDWIKAIPALKQVMILDACNSGKIVEDLAGRKDLNSSQIRALDRMKDRTGMFILTGSAADVVSYEAGQYGQGLLTYSLLQGMSGLALTDDKRVDVMTLFQYSRDHVPDLAKGIGGIQTPILAFPANGASFDIGIVDAQVKIPLAQVKPVFIRNVFQDEDTFDDVLGLTTALASYFQEITTRGAQADLIYVDVSEYENAYSMKGRYKVTGDAVEVRTRLFKGKTAVGQEFKVNGKKSDMPGLVEAILEKGMSIIQ